MLDYIVCARPWRFVRVILASVCKICFFTDVLKLFFTFGPGQGD